MIIKQIIRTIANTSFEFEKVLEIDLKEMKKSILHYKQLSGL